MDCGGSGCGPCPEGAFCAADEDCQRGSGCLSGVCSSTALDIRVGFLVGASVGQSTSTADTCSGLVGVAVLSVGPIRGPGGGASTVRVTGTGFVSVGAGAFRLALSPLPAPVATAITTHTMCTTVSDMQLVCGVGAGSGAVAIDVQYKPFGGSSWASVQPSTTASPLSYTYTYTVGVAVSLSVMRYPPVAVAGGLLPTLEVVLLDGSGHVASSNSHSRVSVMLTLPGSVSGAGKAARVLQGRGLSKQSDCGSSSVGTLTAVAVNGVASFVNVSVDPLVTGAGYALTFAVSGTDVAVTTPAFNVYEAKENATTMVSCDHAYASWVTWVVGACVFGVGGLGGGGQWFYFRQ